MIKTIITAVILKPGIKLPSLQSKQSLKTNIGNERIFKNTELEVVRFHKTVV